MWFMPSYGRPGALAKLMTAPGGLPECIVVLLNSDDPALPRYQRAVAAMPLGQWRIEILPPGSRCADAFRTAFERYPNEPFYGLMDDDHWPVSKGAHRMLELAAEDRYIAIAAGEPSFPRLRTSLVMGGGLVRAMGTLVPKGFRHNYQDDVWDQIATDFNNRRPVPDAIIEHRHWIRGERSKDDTYIRGSADMSEDAVTFRAWLESDDRAQMCKRIAEFLGVGLTVMDMKDKRLAICMLMGDFALDVNTYQALNQSLAALQKMGVTTQVFHAAGGSNVGKARERVLWMAASSAFKPTHLWFLDNDMDWPANLGLHLMASDHDFCGVVGVKKMDELSFCANFLPGHQQFHPRTNFLRVWEIGFGCVMIKASVIDRMVKACPDVAYDTDDGRVEHALFMEMIDKHDGRRQRLSEDLSFCRRWTTKVGGEIYVDHSVSLGHYGRRRYSGHISQIFSTDGDKQAPPPISEAAE